MSGSGVFACARGGVIGGVISSVTGRYCRAARFAGCDVGGAEEARGRGNSSAGLGRSLGGLGSVRGVECRSGSSLLSVVQWVVHLWCSQSPNVSFWEARAQEVVVADSAH